MATQKTGAVASRRYDAHVEQFTEAIGFDLPIAKTSCSKAHADAGRTWLLPERSEMITVTLDEIEKEIERAMEFPSSSKAFTSSRLIKGSAMLAEAAHRA